MKASLGELNLVRIHGDEHVRCPCQVRSEGKPLASEALKLSMTLEGAYLVSRRNLMRCYLKLFLLCLYTHTLHLYVSTQTSWCTYMEVGGPFIGVHHLLLPSGLQVANSGHQVWQQVALSHLTNSCLSYFT